MGNSDGVVFAINHDSMSYAKLPLIIGDESVMKSHDVCIQSAIYRESRTELDTTWRNTIT